MGAPGGYRVNAPPRLMIKLKGTKGNFGEEE